MISRIVVVVCLIIVVCSSGLFGQVSNNLKIDNFLVGIFESGVTGGTKSTKCIHDIQRILNGIDGRELWALKCEWFLFF